MPNESDSKSAHDEPRKSKRCQHKNHHRLSDINSAF